MNDNVTSKKQKKIQKNDKRNHSLDIIALIVSLLASFGVWLFVMNSNQDIIEKKIVVSVDVADQVKKATGYDIISQNDGTDYSQIIVELTISGTQRALEKYDDEDFKIKVKDLDKIDSVGVRTLQFEDPDLPGDDINFVQMTPGYLATVFVDIVTEVEVRLDAGMVGNVKDGIKINENEIKPIGKIVEGEEIRYLETIKIKGPKSIISTVGKAKVSVDVSDCTVSKVQKIKEFEFFDMSGAHIDNRYNYIKVSPTEVDVQIIVRYENKNVPIDISYAASNLDKFKYEYTIAYKDDLNETPSVALSGNSAYFPQKLVYQVGDITDLEEKNYVIVLGKQELETLIANQVDVELELGTNANLDREIVITITKTEISGNSGSSNTDQNENDPGSQKSVFG